MCQSNLNNALQNIGIFGVLVHQTRRLYERKSCILPCTDLLQYKGLLYASQVEIGHLHRKYNFLGKQTIQEIVNTDQIKRHHSISKSFCNDLKKPIIA